MNWRKAALAAALLAVMGLTTVPAAAQPRLKDFPAPFVQNGAIDYNGDGVPDIAIILGSNAAAEDVRGAALIGTKIGSHLYYTKAPNFGAFRIPELTADAYHYAFTRFHFVNGSAQERHGFYFVSGAGVTFPPFSSINPAGDRGLVMYHLAYAMEDMATHDIVPDYLFVPRDNTNFTVTSTIAPCPACPMFTQTTRCVYPNITYSAAAILTDNQRDQLTGGSGAVLFAGLRPTGTVWFIDYRASDNTTADAVVFWNGTVRTQVAAGNRYYINATDWWLQDNGVTAPDNRMVYYPNASGFAMIYQTTPVHTAILNEGQEYYIPFLGYTFYVEDVNLDNTTIIVRDSSGSAVTIMTLIYTALASGTDPVVDKLFISYRDLGGMRILDPEGNNMTFFIYVYRVDNINQRWIEVGISSPWIDKDVFIDNDTTGMAESWPREWNLTPTWAPGFLNWTIHYEDGDPYFIGNITLADVNAAGAIGAKFRSVVSVKADPWNTLPYSPIYGIVSYGSIWNWSASAWYDGPFWYVIYDNGTWPYGQTKTFGSNEFILTAIVNNSSAPLGCSMPACNSTGFGVYLYEAGEQNLTEGFCNLTGSLFFLGRRPPAPGAPNLSQDLIEWFWFLPGANPAPFHYETWDIFPINVTGVFAGAYDRFENVTGNWTGTIVLDAYNRDVTPADEKDQLFELEDVFSFVKAPLVFMDYQFLMPNGSVNEDLADKNLIVVGGPVANTVADFLNDSGLLWVEYVGDRLFDTRFRHDGTVEELGYVDLAAVRLWTGGATVGFIGGLGVVQYAKDDPWGGDNTILVVAGNNRWGTYAAAVAISDPTKIIRDGYSPAVFYLAGTDESEHPPFVIVAAIVPGVAPPAAWVPPTERGVIQIEWPTGIVNEPVELGG